MSEKTRLDSAQAALKLLDQAGSKQEQLYAVMKEMNSVVLAGDNHQDMSKIRDELNKYLDGICESYPPDTRESKTPQFNDEHQSELLTRYRSFAQLLQKHEIDRILHVLRHNKNNLPEAEINEIRQHRDLFAPILLEEFQKQVNIQKEKKRLKSKSPDLDEDEYEYKHSSIPFFAFYLFAEWGYAESVPAVLECLNLPDKEPSKLLGDSIHELAPRYLAQFFAQDHARIDSIIQNRSCYSYVRWAAASSYKYMVRDQVITREDAIKKLEEHFHKSKVIGEDGEPAEDHCYDTTSGIADTLMTLGSTFESLQDDFESHWQFVDYYTVGEPSEDYRQKEYVEKANRQLMPTRPTDFLEEICHWASFKKKETRKPRNVKVSKRYKNFNAALAKNSASQDKSIDNINKPTPDETTTESVKSAPRNAKCPCGSGKKYKQCCMKKNS
jgi:hypothetical protein